MKHFETKSSISNNLSMGRFMLPTWPKSTSILNTHLVSVNTKFELDNVNTFSDNGWKPPLWAIFSHFLATRGPKLGQHCPPKNQFWTLSQQMPTPHLKWIEWLFFQIMVGNSRRTDGRTDIRMLTIPMSSRFHQRGQKNRWTHCPPSATYMG